ncbi:MAG: metal ABC transporter permease [Eubacterium sp.]|jgi:zinc transport system permease protein|nr:metal ABC transporter permease [Eubacterium sp.]
MSQLLYYLQFDFVVYALIVGVLIALCASLLGVTLVLKRYSFIGDGLSHVAFGAMAIATVLKLTSNTILVMPVTILVAVLLLRNGNKSMLKGDAAIAMLSVTSLAFGYLVMNVFSTSSNVSGDVCSTLFGSTSILTLDSKEVMICIVLSIIVIALYVIFYNKIFAVTFDETFCRATGVPAGKYNFLIAVIIAIIIVLGMNLVGSLLISALIVFPALAAMRLSGTFKGVVILSAIFSVVCAIVGMIVSILYSTPVGATIVAMDLLCFIIAALVGRFVVKTGN